MLCQARLAISAQCKKTTSSLSDDGRNAKVDAPSVGLSSESILKLAREDVIVDLESSRAEA